MLDDADLLAQAASHIQEFQQQARNGWLDQMKEAYALREGMQWIEDEYNRVKNDGLTPYTVNLTKPLLESVIGFQIQNRSEATFSPRVTTDDKDRSRAYAETAETGVNWIEDQSQAEFHDSAAFADMVTCGIGATDTSVDYDHDEFGLPYKHRIFPGFLMWDHSAAQKNLRDANWCGWARVVTNSALEMLDDPEAEDTAITPAATFDDSYFLEWFDTIARTSTLSVLYTYYWRQKERVWMIDNPLVMHVNDPLVMTWAAEAGPRLKFDPAASVLSFGKDEWRQFKKEVKGLTELGATIEVPKPRYQSKWRYYRAEFHNGRVRKKSLNFSQTGFPLKFLTGNFSETERLYYGMCRDLRDPQRLLNQAVSDIAGYFRSIPKGGVIIEADAVENVKDFIATYGKARDVTVVDKDAISGGKIMPKQPNPMPPGLLEAAGTYADLMMRVAGLTPQFMGIIETRNMTGVLHQQLVQQGLTVLSPYFDAMRFYIQESGRMYLDLLRILAQNLPERPLRRVSGKAKGEYLLLLEDSLAPEYDVEISDTPLSPVQEQETFDKLMETGMAFLQANPQMGTAMISESLEYSRLSAEAVDRIRQAATPLPQPPNPLETMLVEAETRAKIAEATQKEADAVLKRAQTMKTLAEAGQPAEAVTASAAPTPDPMAVMKEIYDTNQQRERDELEAQRHADEQARKDAEIARKAQAEREKAEFDVALAADEAERKERELALEERRVALEEKKMEREEREAEKAREERREALRYANPQAAEVLELLEEKKKAVEKESEARADAMTREAEAMREAMIGMMERLGVAIKDSLASNAGQTAEVAKGLTTLGKALDKLAAGQEKAAKAHAAGLDKLGRAIADGQEQVAAGIAASAAQSMARMGEVESGIEALADVMSRPRIKKVEIVRDADKLFTDATITETIQ